METSEGTSYEIVQLVFAQIPKDDEHVARPYRYELPSVFPMAPPFSGKVHHPSSPNRCAHTKTSQLISRLLVQIYQQQLSLSKQFYKPEGLRSYQTPRSVFQDGSNETMLSQFHVGGGLKQWLTAQRDTTHAEDHATKYASSSSLPAWTLKVGRTTHTQIGAHLTACPDATYNHFSTQQSRLSNVMHINSLPQIIFSSPSWHVFAIDLEPIFRCG